VTDIPWYQNPTILALLGIVAAIFVSVFAGKTLSRMFRTPELSGRIGLVTWCVLASLIIVNTKQLKFGVDLRGGVTIIGQMNEQPGVPRQDRVTIQKIIPILKERIDPSGVREIVIRALGNDKMEVIIPDVEKEEAERIWKRLTSAGQLFFRIVADENQHPTLLDTAQKTVAERRKEVWSETPDDEGNSRQIGEWVQLAREQPRDGQSSTRLPFKFLPMQTHLLRNKRTGELIDVDMRQFAEGPEGRRQFTRWCADNGHVDVDILMAHPPNDRQNVKGEYLTSVKKGFDEKANPRIEFNLNSQGGKRMFSFTSRNKPVNSRYSLMGIVLDGKLQSAPRINEPIRNNGVIEGSFTEEEIDGYIAVLSSGKLDVALRKNWISMDQILSTLGEELRTRGLLAIGISLSLVLVFMLIYYRFCGLVACLALALNLLFTMAVLMLINVNLTLTGLAGLVLTIGMSVDANVLIFERIREELGRGAALRMAIRNGFDRASTTIVDANLTTLITAVILYVIGTDQLRSFAVTLIVGILMCMFTAIYCSRLIFTIAERRRWITSLKMSQIVNNPLLDFLGKRRIAAVFSILVIAIGITAFFARGKGILDTDLAGGSTARVQFVETMTVDQIREALQQADYRFRNDPIRYSVTQMKDDEYAFKIDSSLPVVDNEEEPEAAEVPKLDQIIGEVFAGKLDMLNLDFDPARIRLVKEGVEVELGNPPSGGGPFAGAAFSSLDLPDDAGWQQESGEQESGEQESGQQESGQQDGPEAVQASGTDQAAAEAPPQQNLDALQAPAGQDPGNAGTGSPANGAGRQPYTATVDLKFKHPLTGESVRGYIDAAAQSLGDVPLDKDVDITLQGPDDTESLQDRSDRWTVTLNVYEPDDAARVLNRVKETMAAQPYFASSSGVGGQVAARAQQQALVAIIASLIGIIGYVWIRFQNVAFGLAAIVALVHDVLVVLGAIAISYWLAGVFGFLLIEDFRISLSVVAALLTIIGYSLNDTIVVFDRIREVRGKRTDITSDMINRSISQTLSRTILTSLTTLIVVIILYVLGGESIHAFAFALVIGVLVGTYSSIFVASPTLLWLMNRGVAPPAVTPEKPSATGKA
jgi:SecD/SecF fusion protein